MQAAKKIELECHLVELEVLSDSLNGVLMGLTSLRFPALVSRDFMVTI